MEKLILEEMYFINEKDYKGRKTEVLKQDDWFNICETKALLRNIESIKFNAIFNAMPNKSCKKRGENK